MKQKIITILLCVVMVGTLLTGCGSNSSESDSSSKGSDDSSTGSEPASESGGSTSGDSVGSDEQITLKISTWEASALESEAIRKAIEGFEAENPNINVEYSVNAYNEHHSKLNTQMNSGEAPDVFWVNPEYMRDFVNREQLLDLTEHMEKNNVDVSDYLDSSLEKMKFIGDDGEEYIYGVDCCIVGPLMFYNKDLFDEAGVDYIPSTLEEQWTWDEFVENMKKLTIVENGETSQYGTCNFEEKFTLYTTLELLGSNGATLFNGDYTEAIGIDSPETRDTLEKIKALRTEHGVSPSPTAAGVDSGNSQTSMFMTGKVASVFVGSYALQELSQSGINLGVGLPPKMSEGTKPIGSANLDCIWKDTKYPEEAFKLVQYLTSVETCTPIYQSGLWMPNRHSLYEEGNIDTWFNEEVYPKEWLDMLWLWEDAALRPFDHLHNTNQIYDVSQEAVEEYFYNDEDLDVILPNWQNEVNDLLSE